jgi:hypothetical protein
LTVDVETVTGAGGRGGGLQGTVGEGGGEEVIVRGIEAAGVVRDDVRGSGAQGDGGGRVACSWALESFPLSSKCRRDSSPLSVKPAKKLESVGRLPRR